MEVAHRRTMLACLAATALIMGATACGGDDESADTAAPVVTDAPADTTAAPDTSPADTTADTTADTAAPTDDLEATAVFPTLAPPTGEEMVIGLVNTEGTPGLDFPDIREDIAGTIDYLNQHGGVGNRPVKLETCVATGAPETSQACAQELTGKGVELVMLGLDLFPDYATYTAAGVPVIGMLPILPGDYNADARLLTGGNATTMAAAAGAAKEHFGATTVGIVSADNAGANGTLASLTAALDKVGITYKSVKGGDNETDAGYQGLMREAAADNPDLLISLYSDAGCIGTMRGRASLGITIPVITTGICSGTDVLEQVGDDAVGWNFIGVSTQEDTPELAILQDIMAPVLDIEPSEVDSTALGLGALGLTMMMSIALFGNAIAADGGDVTGASIYEYLDASDNIVSWPGTTPLECGASPAYSSVCAFVLPFAEYLEGGEIRTIEGLEAFSALEYLP
jgi:ABC-type branched-subunit amino acid transport system substrate-binding protein